MYMKDWSQYMLPFTWLILFISAGILIEKLVAVALRKRAAVTGSRMENIIWSSLKGMIIFWAGLTGIYFSARTIEIPSHFLPVYKRSFIVLIVFSVAIVINRLSVGLIRRQVRHATKYHSTSIIVNIVRIGIVIICGGIVLQILGIPVTPVLTALGVGALAVALALQDTLTNLFSGVQVIASRQVRTGDYIKLDTGDEGYVSDITWRNTIVRALSNNYIIIPNSKIATAIVTNYYLPEREMSVLVELSVAYSSDLHRVEDVTVAAAKEVLQNVSGGVETFEPFIRFHTFGESSIKFSVILRGKEFTDQYLIKHEFIKLIIERFREYKIEIPFPTRTIYTNNKMQA